MVPCMDSAVEPLGMQKPMHPIEPAARGELAFEESDLEGRVRVVENYMKTRICLATSHTLGRLAISLRIPKNLKVGWHRGLEFGERDGRRRD